jgi:hypothetical protein
MDAVQLKIDLESITGRCPVKVDETMSHVLGRLDTLAQSSHIPGRLQHYLSKRSYVKALAWLEDPESPHHP